MGTKGTGKNLRILILGDSAAAGVGVAHQNQALLGQLIGNLTDDYCVFWELDAETGATTYQTFTSLENKIGINQFDVVITSLGVNDVTSNISLPKWLKLQNLLHEMCFKKFNSQLVIVTELPPMGKFPALPQPLRWYLGRRATQLNQALEKLVSYNSKLVYLSIGSMKNKNTMASDGFHPGEKVYQQWAKTAAAIIKSKF